MFLIQPEALRDHQIGEGFGLVFMGNQMFF